MDAKAEENRRIGGEAKQEKVARSRFCGGRDQILQVLK